MPLTKLARAKNIARSSLVTLPIFVQDQAKYKAMLQSIGRLNGIIKDNSPLGVMPKTKIGRAESIRRTAARRKAAIRGKAQSSPSMSCGPPKPTESSSPATSKSWGDVCGVQEVLTCIIPPCFEPIEPFDGAAEELPRVAKDVDSNWRYVGSGGPEGLLEA